MFAFFDTGELRDHELILRLAEQRPANAEKGWGFCFVFHMVSADTGALAGEIQLRIGDTPQMRLYGGHVGYGVHPDYRGRRFAARALRLLLPLAREHGLVELWTTCNPENAASRRTCETAGADLVEIVDLPPELDIFQRRAPKMPLPPGAVVYRRSRASRSQPASWAADS